ncbi:MAG: VTT domain-containing protein [Flavobacteriales bacterium]|nr:VTT domain-containing protein [Flavobacteriales bacterium]
MEYLTETISSSGGFGVLLFILAYAIGTLMNIPGVIFLFIAFMVYSGITGVVIGYSGTLIAMVVHFFFVRTMGGEALSEIKQPFIRKQMQKLTDNPIKTTVILRLVLFVSPPVNYALALSSIRFRDFLIGSMIALPGNIVFNYLLMVYAKDFILAQFA